MRRNAMRRAGFCSQDEIALFSISNTTNAHAAEPSFYKGFSGEYGQEGKQVCATDVNTATIAEECDGIQNPVLSFYDSDAGTSHLAAVDDRYDETLCSDNLATSVWRSCPGDSKPIVSIYGPVENHVAKPGFYDWHICGAVFQNVTLAYKFTMEGNTSFIINLNETNTSRIEETDDLPGYASVENESVMSGIVGGSDLPHTVGIHNDSGRVTLNHTLHSSDNYQWFLPFTTGTHLDIENRLGLIEDNTFMSQFNPNFAFEIAEQVLVEVSLVMDVIDLVGDIDIGPGIHELIIENLGTNSKGQPKVRINATT
jgi:hypothetical protein